MPSLIGVPSVIRLKSIIFAKPLINGVACHPEVVESHDGDGITDELHLPEAFRVVATDRELVFGPDIFMTNLMRNQRPQLFDIEKSERTLGDDHDGAGMDADGCLWDVDDLDFVNPVTLRRPQKIAETRQFLASGYAQTGNLTVWRKRPENSRLGLARNRRRPGDFQEAHKRGGIGGEQIMPDWRWSGSARARGPHLAESQTVRRQRARRPGTGID